MKIVRRSAKGGMRHAQRIVVDRRFPISGAHVVDLVLVVDVGEMDLVRRNAHDRSTSLMQLFNVNILAAVVAGLVELGHGGKERTGHIGKRVEEATVDAYRCDVERKVGLRTCHLRGRCSRSARG